MKNERNRQFESAITEVEAVLKNGTADFERTLIPVRRELWRRYPAVFLLLVTVGITATFTGIEQLLLSYELLRAHPIVILCIGVTILTLTGTIYKKLG